MTAEMTSPVLQPPPNIENDSVRSAHCEVVLWWLTELYGLTEQYGMD